MWFCYILRCTDEKHKNLTYNGSTNNIIKRLRQHNGELKGGAKATSGKKWEIYALMVGFADHNNALSCEWRIKHPTKAKKRPPKYCGIMGRILGLNEVIISDKWTNKCKYNNSEGKYKLFVTVDVAHLLDLDSAPSNIEIYKVNKMSLTFLNGVTNDIY